MDINHRPTYNTKLIEDYYTKKDGVPIKYVCTSALGSESFAGDIFYRDTPHPEFGNWYLQLYGVGSQMFIRSADKIEDEVFIMLDTPSGYHYSRHRHDFFTVGDSSIDGGRAYARLVGNNVKTKQFKIRDGEFYEV